MYRNIAWFTFGYFAHKHLFPIAIDVMKKLNEKQEAAKRDQRKMVIIKDDYTSVEAKDVSVISNLVDELYAAHARFGSVAVSDVKDLLSVPTNVTDTKRGWKSVQEFRVSQDGLRLDLPLPQPI